MDAQAGTADWDLQGGRFVGVGAVQDDAFGVVADGVAGVFEAGEHTARAGVFLLDLGALGEAARVARRGELGGLVADAHDAVADEYFGADRKLQGACSVVVGELDVDAGADAARLAGLLGFGQVCAAVVVAFVAGQPAAGYPEEWLPVANDVAAPLGAAEQPFDGELLERLVDGRAAGVVALCQLVFAGQPVAGCQLAAVDQFAHRCSDFLALAGRHAPLTCRQRSTCPTGLPNRTRLGVDIWGPRADAATCQTCQTSLLVRHDEHRAPVVVGRRPGRDQHFGGVIVSENTTGSGQSGGARPRLLRVGLGVSLALVILAPELAAWQGLLGLARDELGLAAGWDYLVPLLFGAAAAYCALLAVRHVLAGDSAVTERALTWIYAAAGAGFNWHHAERAGNAAAAIFFAGASLSAALLWDRTLRAWRRDELRAAGALERPLPRFRLLRWLVAWGETWDAWRLAVREGITSPDEALCRARAERLGMSDELIVGGSSMGKTTFPAADLSSPRAIEGAQMAVDEPAANLVGLSKKAAVGAAFDALGRRDVVAALVWLKQRGVTVDRSYAYTVEWQPPRPQLVVSGGEQR